MFVGTLLHLYLLKGMEFHLGFKPHTYSLCIYLHSISAILMLSFVDLRLMRFHEITESKFSLIFCFCPGYQGHRNFIVFIILKLFGDVLTVFTVLFVILCCNSV